MKELKERMVKMQTLSLKEFEKVNMDQFAQENEKNMFVLQTILVIGAYKKDIK